VSRASVCPRTGGELAALLVLRALDLLEPESIRGAFPAGSVDPGMLDEAIERIEWLRGEVTRGVVI
jgi:hypothetical protein